MHSTNASACGSRVGWRHYGFVVLGTVVMVVFCALGLARFGYTSILPSMQEALGLTNTQTGLLQSWNLLGYMLTVAGAGALAARRGPRAVITAALLVVALGMILTGVVADFSAACVGRFLAGVGGAAGNVPAMALLAAWFAPRRRGVASGLGVAGSSLALMVTGPLIPVLVARGGPDGWRLGWFVLGGLTLVGAVLAGVLLRNQPAEKGLRAVGESDGRVAPPSAGPMAGAPDWRSVYRSRLLWHLAGIYFAFGFSYIIYSTFFVRHLTAEAGFSAAAAGRVWFYIGLVSALSGLCWGAVSDRWGRRLALLCVFGIQGAAFAALGLRPTAWVVSASATLFALTAWSVPALMATLCGDLFGARLAPAALGWITMVFGLGQVLGPYAAGRLADASQSFGPAFVLAAAVAWLLGAGGTLLLRLPKAGSGSAMATR